MGGWILVRVCMECKQPAKYKAQTFDGQTIYLCEEHVKGWHVPKIAKLKVPQQPQTK